MSKIFEYLAIAIIISAGIFVRFDNLGTYMANIDDFIVAHYIIDYGHEYNGSTEGDLNLHRFKINDFKNPSFHSLKNKIKRKLDEYGLFETYLYVRNYLFSFPNMFPVSIYSTYAPLQFLLTNFLISKDQSYQDIVFFGRIPSFICGLLGLFFMFLFSVKYQPNQFSVQIVALSLLAFSWENIIFSNQMSNYASGVTSILLLFFMFIKFLDFESINYKSLIFLGLILGTLGYAQYQLLIFIPAFYIALFLYHWIVSKVDVLQLARKMGVAILISFILGIKLILDFLVNGANKQSIHWNSGLNGEYAFTFGEGIFNNLYYIISFFVKNTYIVLQSMVSFVPENSFLFPFVSGAIAILFILGVLSLIRASDQKKKYLFLFFILSAFTYITLIILGKLAFSPTRHSLVLLPFFVVVISEGFQFMLNLFRCSERSAFLNTACVVLFIIGAFFYNYSSFTSNRLEVLNEQEIKSTLDNHNVDIIITSNNTLNLLFMQSIKNSFSMVHMPMRSHSWFQSILGSTDVRTIAFLSVGQALNLPKDFKQNMTLINDKAGGLIEIDSNYESYENIYTEKKDTGQPIVEFSNKTLNGTVSYEFLILRR